MCVCKTQILGTEVSNLWFMLNCMCGGGYENFSCMTVGGTKFFFVHEWGGRKKLALFLDPFRPRERNVNDRSLIRP